MVSESLAQMISNNRVTNESLNEIFGSFSNKSFESKEHLSPKDLKLLLENDSSGFYLIKSLVENQIRNLKLRLKSTSETFKLLYSPDMLVYYNNSFKLCIKYLVEQANVMLEQHKQFMLVSKNIELLIK